MKHRLAHAEAVANAITGTILAQLILFGFGIEFRQAVALNVAMLAMSYVRSYVLRRLFMRLG